MTSGSIELFTLERLDLPVDEERSFLLEELRITLAIVRVFLDLGYDTLTDYDFVEQMRFSSVIPTLSNTRIEMDLSETLRISFKAEPTLLVRLFSR